MELGKRLRARQIFDQNQTHALKYDNDMILAATFFYDYE
jgi:hypothetical protein